MLCLLVYLSVYSCLMKMLGDEIGKGAYGRVYKGLDLENGDFVAIKQVSLENIAQEDLNIIMVFFYILKNFISFSIPMFLLGFVLVVLIKVWN